MWYAGKSFCAGPFSYEQNVADCPFSIESHVCSVVWSTYFTFNFWAQIGLELHKEWIRRRAAMRHPYLHTTAWSPSVSLNKLGLSRNHYLQCHELRRHWAVQSRQWCDTTTEKVVVASENNKLCVVFLSELIDNEKGTVVSYLYFTW